MFVRANTRYMGKGDVTLTAYDERLTALLEFRRLRGGGGSLKLTE